MEISEIQNIVYHNLQNLKSNTYTPTSLLDYFVSRQYINLYNASFINFALQDVGHKILQFVDLVDTTHPDIVSACEGVFDLSSNFSQYVLECFEVAKVAQKNNLNLVVPALVKDLKQKNRRLLGFLSDVSQYIRLFKDDLTRNSVRLACARDIRVKLSKPYWPAIVPTFKPFVLSTHGDYYGFKKITMTNAAIILCKMMNCYQKEVKFTIPFSWVLKVTSVMKILDHYPPANNKPIFDNFWQIGVNQSHVLLGEKEKKCYFIICWN